MPRSISDCSLSYYSQQLGQNPQPIGLIKLCLVMFGTDWPAPFVPSMKENIRQFYALPMAEQAKRQILRETALNVFGTG